MGLAVASHASCGSGERGRARSLGGAIRGTSRAVGVPALSAERTPGAADRRPDLASEFPLITRRYQFSACV